MKIEN